MENNLNESIDAVIEDNPYDFKELVLEDLQNRYNDRLLTLKEEYQLFSEDDDYLEEKRLSGGGNLYPSATSTANKLRKSYDLSRKKSGIRKSYMDAMNAAKTPKARDRLFDKMNKTLGKKTIKFPSNKLGSGGEIARRGGKLAPKLRSRYNYLKGGGKFTGKGMDAVSVKRRAAARATEYAKSQSLSSRVSTFASNHPYSIGLLAAAIVGGSVWAYANKKFKAKHGRNISLSDVKNKFKSMTGSAKAAVKEKAKRLRDKGGRYMKEELDYDFEHEEYLIEDNYENEFDIFLFEEVDEFPEDISILEEDFDQLDEMSLDSIKNKASKFTTDNYNTAKQLGKTGMDYVSKNPTISTGVIAAVLVGGAALMYARKKYKEKYGKNLSTSDAKRAYSTASSEKKRSIQDKVKTLKKKVR